MRTNDLTIIGCGGHGSVVLDALELSENNGIITLLDDNPVLLGRYISTYLVQKIGDLSALTGKIHVAIGHNLVRKRFYEDLSGAILLNIVHPLAVISKNATLGKGVFVAANVILAPRSVVGDGCIINHAAVIDHDVRIGAYTHIAPNSTLGGNVSIGSCVLIGAGAVVLPGIRIGDGVIVGAGSVVTRDVAANKVVKGVPAE